MDVFVFVDNSNIWIEGKKLSGRKKTPPVDSNHKYRIEYGKLLSHILNGRTTASIPKLYGSRPPPNDSVWKMMQSKGYDPVVLDRNFFGKEKGVDMRMGMDIAKLLYKEQSAPATLILVAGDGDFVPVVEDACQAGWHVEVWYWGHAAQTLKAAASKFVALDDGIYTIGFDEA